MSGFVKCSQLSSYSDDENFESQRASGTVAGGAAPRGALLVCTGCGGASAGFSASSPTTGSVDVRLGLTGVPGSRPAVSNCID